MTTIIYGAMNAPIMAAGLLYAMTAAPEQIQSRVMAFMESWFSPTAIRRSIFILSGVVAAGLARLINGALNTFALSHWQLRSTKSRWMWSKEIAIVTGGCSGLGKALVNELHSKGIRVGILDVGELPEEFKNKSGILYCRTNVTSIDEVHAAGISVRKAFGNPSILVNCAGVLPLGLVLEGETGDIERSFSINTISHFWTAQEFIPAMIESDKGHVVCIASMASFATMPGIVAYGCSKASAATFQEGSIQVRRHCLKAIPLTTFIGLSAELKHIYRCKGIMLTTVYPGNMDTNMLSKFQSDQERTMPKNRSPPEALAERIVAQVQSGRGAQLILPNTIEFQIASMLRALPSWLQEGLGDIGLVVGDDCPLTTLRSRSRFVAQQ